MAHTAGILFTNCAKKYIQTKRKKDVTVIFSLCGILSVNSVILMSNAQGQYNMSRKRRRRVCMRRMIIDPMHFISDMGGLLGEE